MNWIRELLTAPSSSDELQLVNEYLDELPEAAYAVTLDSTGDVQFWTSFFRCSEAELRDALEHAGTELWPVQEYVWARRESLAAGPGGPRATSTPSTTVRHRARAVPPRKSRRPRPVGRYRA